jgi:hypothetical protein
VSPSYRDHQPAATAKRAECYQASSPADGMRIRTAAIRGAGGDQGEAWTSSAGLYGAKAIND